MKLAHLKVKTDREETTPDSTREDADRYPEGMKIRMGHEEMTKMGMKETPAPGHEMHFEGRGVVTHSHQHPTDKEDRHVEVQFTHGGAEHKAEEVPEKSLRDTIGEAQKKVTPGESRLERSQSRGKDAGKRPGAAVEPPEAA